MRKWGRKSDSHQPNVVAELRQAGCSVWVLSRCPAVLDLIVGWRDQVWWVELKHPGEGLTKKEKEIFEAFMGNSNVIVGYDTEDILRQMGAMK